MDTARLAEAVDPSLVLLTVEEAAPHPRKVRYLRYPAPKTWPDLR
ncbi:hypothetical protein GCM10022207_11750 [Streptomyces lannensis]|uniref:Uncharacterized protein n=1 Tax=Streptomyces lannensis TaxID=766498 RepID=A0ABP7JRK9_9ACTN